MSQMGHSLPIHSTLMANNVRCYSNSDHSRHEAELTRSANRDIAFYARTSDTLISMALTCRWGSRPQHQLRTSRLHNALQIKRSPTLLANSPKGHISSCMIDILDTGRVSGDEPNLMVRKAPHAPIWSVWAVLEGIPSEEIFEGSSEEEASSWINTGGGAWLEERRRKRNA
jgi:hypothetical protein